MNSRAVFNFKYLEKDLSLSGKNKCLAKRLLETLNKENNKLDKPENRIKTVSIDVIKELVTETFKVQVETIRKIVSSCNTDTIARLEWLTEKIQDNNGRLNILLK